MSNQPKLEHDLAVIDALRVEMQNGWPGWPPEGIYSALNSAIFALKHVIQEFETAGLSDHRVDL